MKRIMAIVLTVCLFVSVVACANADTVKVPIDISSMETADLLALDVLIHQELSARGESSTETAAPEATPMPEATTEADDGIDTMSEGESELSDEYFLRDMSAGLVARWAVPSKDTTIMSNKQIAAYYSMLVNSELVYVAKYSDYAFEDEHLGDYAHGYINALQNQLIGVTEYLGKDENLYNQYWGTEGYNVRGRYIYLINKEYGLEIPEQYNSILLEMVTVGQLYNYVIPMETAVADELYKVELEFDTSSNRYLYVKPFNFKNSSPFDISGLTIKINFVNAKEVVVDSGYLLSYDNVAAGKSISTQKVSTKEHFTHVTYTYSFRVQTPSYYNDCEATVTPAVQYSWDGKVKKNGQLAAGQAVLEIKNLTSGWEMNTSWSKTLYVPVLKFDVFNSGTGEAESVVVRVVFTNPETKQVWDEETTYVVGSSDSPLKSGFSKKAFVYSSVGYKTKITPPELTAEIYINDELVKTITINK